MPGEMESSSYLVLQMTLFAKGKSPSSKGRKPTSASPGFALFKDEQQEKMKSSPSDSGKKRKILSVKEAKAMWDELGESDRKVG
jgi:hypothetical protein